MGNIKKIVIVGLLVIIGFFSLALICYFPLQTLAQEYSPLDFASDYKKFEATVGVDDNNGRYITYHYEFND